MEDIAEREEEVLNFVVVLEVGQRVRLQVVERRRRSAELRGEEERDCRAGERSARRRERERI